MGGSAARSAAGHSPVPGRVRPAQGEKRQLHRRPTPAASSRMIESSCVVIAARNSAFPRRQSEASSNAPGAMLDWSFSGRRPGRRKSPRSRSRKDSPRRSPSNSRHPPSTSLRAPHRPHPHLHSGLSFAKNVRIATPFAEIIHRYASNVAMISPNRLPSPRARPARRARPSTRPRPESASPAASTSRPAAAC